MSIRLYSYWRSSAAYRVRIALNLKGLAHEIVPVSLAPVALGLLGEIYLAVALGMNAWFVWSSVRLLRERSDAAARRTFQVSLAYLGSLFLAMNVELLVGA